MFAESEARLCPECGVDLVETHKMPPTQEELAERARAIEATHPADRLVAWHYARRGRGPLLVLALAGLVAYGLPWVEMTQPSIRTYSGYDLARRTFWLWGGAVAWFISLPLVFTRRTVHEMRGVRAVLVLFGLTAFAEVLLFVYQAPRQTSAAPVLFEYGYGLYVNAALSVLFIGMALRFGGDPERFEVDFAKPREPHVPEESSSGEIVH
jgi:hypothetical protein